ncbi:ADYC domain-containing protein [Microvirga pudoricolor]|uniref:ADYC domain-containing protein n=1 Tax=Microvirga pudoricolor TaxID=2778729 RepID=UPI00194FDF0C|nr:ADYC domain-containing protein [Microvirga pudoricolor]MBM6594655.1 hypothetical protein [Microvirga pudoricolor]
MTRLAIYLALLFGLVGSMPAWAASLRAEGLNLVLGLDDGRELRGQALVGLVLTLGAPGRERDVRIDGIVYEGPFRQSTATFYSMSLRDRETGRFKPLCQADGDGDRAAIAYPDGASGFSLTCSAGAEGKCILFGYFPWEQRDDVPMRDLHRACIHMIRADYGGDDNPAARSGTPINVFDRFGIQNPARVKGMEFEAGWGPDGAVCVNHPRIADLVSLDDLAARYPALRGRLGAHVCFEQNARMDSRALIFNESRLTWKTPR